MELTIFLGVGETPGSSRDLTIGIDCPRLSSHVWVMSDSLRTRIQALLAAPESSSRDQLLGLVFDAVLAQPVSSLIERNALVGAIYRGLTQANAQRIAERHVLPAVERVAEGLEGKPERVSDLLSPEAARLLAEVVRSGKGPRFEWLKGAFDGDDLRQLVAPIVQQLLLQFTAKLPIPGLSGGALGGAGGGALGGLVGRIGKQVQKSAGQLADVGRSMMGSVIRDFSESATSEFRQALDLRLKSSEGRQIVERMRDRIVMEVLSASADQVARDFMHLPRPEIARIVALTIEHQRELPRFRAIFEREISAALDVLGDKSLRDLLEEMALLESTRVLVLRAATPAVAELARSAAFGDWLERLLGEAEHT
jgi:hypothetical protein